MQHVNSCISVWVYQYPSLQAKTASKLGHGDVAISNPHMWRHGHTIYQRKFKVKQTETELKKKQNQSKVFCKQDVMRFLWNFIHRDLTMTVTLKNNNKHQCFDHHHFPKSQ